MARPRVDKSLEVDAYILARVHDESRKSFAPPTTIVRRVVKGCWNGDPEFVGVLANLFPSPSSAELSASLDGEPRQVQGGLLVPLIDRSAGELHGSWVFVPALEAIHRLLGAGSTEDAVVRRILRRIRPEALRIRGKLVGRWSRASLEAPYLEFDTRRGRKPKHRV